MSEKKAASIPVWQKASNSENAPPKSPAEDARSEELDVQPSKETVRDHARQFLEDPSIRNAATEKKAAFLASKGLRRDEIQKLLSSEPSSIQTTSTSSTDTPGLKSIHNTSNTPQSSTAPSRDTLSPPTLTTNPSSNPTPPPIITYPEFLLQAQKPPPLITLRRLLYTFYLLAGLGATVHGTGKYLIAPLLASLSEARHSFFKSAQSNLKTLNAKLSSNVSHVPPPLLSSLKQKQREEENNDDDVSSRASDPTELFHRDIATQTSPSLPQTPLPTTTISSGSSSPFPFSQLSTTHRQPLDTQTTSLSTLSAHLRSLIDLPLSSSSFPATSSHSTETLSSSLSSLKSYLDTLTYSANDSSSYYDRAYAGVYDFTNNNTDHGKEQGQDRKSKYNTALAARVAKDKSRDEDEVARFKAEIRSVKGVLLSARNFPVARN